jgi:glucosamine--fructose-6-phosphate aminotransferase (isomerizing)
MRARGARILLAAPAGTPGANLPLAESASVELEPVSVIQSFYPMVEALSRARGRNPDEPRFLNKVTRTH